MTLRTFTGLPFYRTKGAPRMKRSIRSRVAVRIVNSVWPIMRGLGSDPSMGARRLARARVGAVTSADRVRGSGAAVQLWGGLEGADLGKAVQRSGRPAFVAMMEPTDFG